MRYSVISLALALCACGQPKPVAEFIPTPPERLVCALGGTRPKIPPEYVIDWAKVSTVAQSHAEHDKYVATIRNREGVVAGYVLDIEGKLFTCFNNAQWRRDFEADLAKSHGEVR